MCVCVCVCVWTGFNNYSTELISFVISAKEKERQTPDEKDHSADGHSVRDSERESVGLWHDGGGALLPVHPQLLQPARHQSVRMVRMFKTPESLTDFTIDHSVCKISIKMWKIPVFQSDISSAVEEMLRWEIICTWMLFVASFTRSYALPTKSTEVLLMQEQGTKMYVDAILKTHERVVQVKRSLCLPRSLTALVRPDYWSVLFIRVSSWALWTPRCVPFSWTCFLSISQREFSCLWRRWVSVTTASRQQTLESCDCFKSNNLSCFCFFSQHTEADFQARFKARPEMEGLIAQIKY